MNATTKVKDVLTTGEVAKICNVAPRTVSKWFDSGALHGPETLVSPTSRYLSVIIYPRGESA